MAKERRATTAYRITAAPEIYDHLARFSKRDQSRILDALPRQLGHQPTVETRNRKRLVANPIAPWELRVGRYRYTSRCRKSLSGSWRSSRSG